VGTKEKHLPSIIIFISIISILFLSQIFSNNSRIKILNIFRGPLRVISGSCYVLRDVSNFKDLNMENKILKENVDNLEREILNLRETALENQRLRGLLGFRESKKHRFIPSMVIARDPLGLKDTIIIDKGKAHDVRKDMVVISGNGLVGRVRESGWSISRVLLITDRDSVVGAIVQRTRDEGAVVGMGRGGVTPPLLVMKYLELSSNVNKGDKVISSGFSGIFEKGILIGEVVSVEKDASGLYLNARIEPEVDVMRLEEVLVMK